jgi:hypothetical protein
MFLIQENKEGFFS